MYQFKTLLIHQSTPLVTALLFNQSETSSFIQMPGGAEPFEGPEEYPLVAPSAAKRHCMIHEFPAYPFTPQCIRRDKPPQMSPFIFSVNTVYNNSAFYSAIFFSKPNTIPFFIKPLKKVR